MYMTGNTAYKAFQTKLVIKSFQMRDIRFVNSNDEKWFSLKSLCVVPGLFILPPIL